MSHFMRPCLILGIICAPYLANIRKKSPAPFSDIRQRVLRRFQHGMQLDSEDALLLLGVIRDEVCLLAVEETRVAFVKRMPGQRVAW